MFKKSVLTSAILTAAVLSTGAAAAESGEGFIDGSTMDIGVMYYGRERDHKVKMLQDGGKLDDREIRVNALGLNANLQSGWYDGWFGLDASVFSNIDLMGGSGHGQSEVLYYKYGDNEERNSSRIGKLRTRFKWGDDTAGVLVKAGVTDINAGTIGTSAGINSHAYRGVEAKGHFENFSLSYGYADRFMNDWDDSLRRMTNKYDQYRENDKQNVPGTGAEIDYIHSIGGRYQVDSGWVDVAAGEGKGYRKNYHLAGSYNVGFSEETSLTLTTYYQSAKYQEDLGSGMIKETGNAEREWTWSSSAVVDHGGWSFIGGYGETHAPDSGEYQLRLTAWGNSDHRNFIQTASTLDDFLWDGQKVVKAGVSYNFAEEGLPGLTVGTSYFYSWDGYNLKGTANENRDAKMQALDFQFMYSFQSEQLKGLWVGVFPSFLRVKDTAKGDDLSGVTGRDIDKVDRNDVKVMATYNISVF